MKTKILFAGLAASLLFIGFTSCKKCDVGDDSATGQITAVPDYEDVVIYSEVLGTTTGPHITGSSPHANKFEVSFDGGKTKGGVPWGTYDILANPMTIDCEASFARNVYYGPLANMVTYEVIATTCSSCENARTVNNFILVPKIPAGYTVFTESSIMTQ